MSSPPPPLSTRPLAPRLDRGAMPADLELLGRYRLLSRLAIGGMAEIFLARVEGIGGFEKVVVVKRMIPQYAADPVLVRMFMDEARLLAKLDHPNITQVHDVGTQDGHYFFAMEFVHGEDLRSITRAAALNDMPIGDVLIAAIIVSAAKALHYVHEKCTDDGRPLHIVHRDVSPSNILVGWNGTVKLADFGVAKWDEQQTQTTHGTLKGKLAYMSPEQAKGAPVDRRSDIFSLGVLMFELFTGTRLFQGATEMAILEQVTAGFVPNPTRRRPDLPAALESIILRALAPLPQDRFATAQELSHALTGFITSQSESCDTSALSGLLMRLFAGKLATWQEAEQGGLTLGEHLARLPAADVLPTPDTDMDSDSRNTTRPEALSLQAGNSPQSARMRWRTRLGWTTAGAACLAAVVLAVGRPSAIVSPSIPLTSPDLSAPPQEPARSTPFIPTPTAAVLPNAPRSARRKQRPKPPPLSAPAKPPQKDDTVRVWDPDSVLLPK